MKRGFSALSLRTSRRRLMALFKPRSKSTKVLLLHSLRVSSSRVTTSPGTLQQQNEHLKRLLLQLEPRALTAQLAGSGIHLEGPKTDGRGHRALLKWCGV